jgi:aspartyl-tRNA synthetase
VIFIDLRDRYGLTQAVFSPQDHPEAHTVAERLRNEYVVSVAGVVRPRSAETVNPKLPTGAVEIRGIEIKILNTSSPLPFAVSAHEEKQTNASEEVRLRYRYLDLRRPGLRQNLVERHRLCQATRRYFSEHDFLEVETPVLMKSTPEGARDYLVPSRVHPGKFYALPQSPQTYKQITMVAGLDRYFQIVKCFRDEDLRADRQPEFTQIDVEISFANEEVVLGLMEGLIEAIWRDVKGVELQMPFPRISYSDALERYGSDKPDTRFGLELVDLSTSFEGSPFRVFQSTLEAGGAIIGINIPGEGSRGRGAMDRLDKDIVRKRIGAGGLIYFKIAGDGGVYSSVKDSVLPTSYVDSAVQAVGAKPGDLVLLLAGEKPTVLEQAGALRLHMGRELGLIPAAGEAPWNFLWVTEFPLLEWSKEERRWSAMHHPFTSPRPEDVEFMESDPGRVLARAYDLVLNGTEIGGGSIRIHDRDLQRRMFQVLGIDDEEASRRFGFLLDAFQYGAPPHGGIAFGLDPLAMLLSGASNIRDVIAYPKTQKAQELMVDSPDVVSRDQLEELHIEVKE